MRRILFAALPVALILSAGTPATAQTCSIYQVVPPDGRVFGPVTNNGTTVVVPYFQSEAGRSYSIEVVPTTGGLANAPATGGVNQSCPASDSGVTSTITMSPKVDSTAYRVTVTPGSTGYIVTRVNTGTFTYSVSETTLFNTTWSTGGTYATQWGLQNTTGQTVNGVLTVQESLGGSATYTRNVTLPGNSTTFVTTFDTFTGGPIPSGRGGSAMFSHGAPPGAILGDAFIVNAAGAVIPAAFRAGRDQGR